MTSVHEMLMDKWTSYGFEIQSIKEQSCALLGLELIVVFENTDKHEVSWFLQWPKIEAAAAEFGYKVIRVVNEEDKAQVLLIKHEVLLEVNKRFRKMHIELKNSYWSLQGCPIVNKLVTEVERLYTLNKQLLTKLSAKQSFEVIKERVHTRVILDMWLQYKEDLVIASGIFESDDFVSEALRQEWLELKIVSLVTGG